VVLLFAVGTLWAAEPVRIGVLAYPPKPWQPLVAELKRQIPERDFIVEVLEHGALEQAVASHRIDFVLTNAGHYLLMQRRSGLSSPLATLMNNERGRRLTVFGGAIVVRADRSDIKTLKDVRGKTVAYADFSALGGFQAQAYELAINGIDPRHDVRLLKMGTPHQKSIQAVLSGQADVGFVRTGLLEEMADNGKLDPASLRVLNRQDLPDFPWQASTHLYPEWSFAALPNTDELLARRVTAALFLLDRNPDLVRSMKIEGFTVPADYQAVEDMLWKLQLPPFETASRFTFADVWAKYRWQIFGALLLLGTVLLLSFQLILANRRLRAAKASLGRSEKHYRLLVEHMRDVVWILDPDTLRFSYVSPSVRRLRGYTAEEVMNEPLDAALTPEFAEALRAAIPERVADFISSAEQDKSYAEEVLQPCKDGSQVWTESITKYYRNEETGKIEIHGVTRDIAERKKALDALHRSNAELEQFAYSVSHDMRQPLRMVSGHLQLLERALGKNLDDEQRQTLRFALDGAKRMDSMIVSLLDYSRVGRKTEAKAWQPSRASLDEAMAFLEPMIHDAAAEVNLGGDWPQVYASRDELVRLFQNLIGNGIKFCEPGKPPRVEIESGVDGGVWRVAVRDHGIGIDPKQQDRLFQFFSRLQSRARYDGTGMGLALCRRIVEHHGGRIWAESEGDGKGCAFVFELPLGMENAVSSGS
jgi:PAS domain S-box-containing protein